MNNNVLVKATGLSKIYRKDGFALEPINLELKANEITGLVGENGNGKTTLLTMLAGMLNPSQGQIDYSFGSQTAWDELKMQIGYISQSLRTWTGTVYENLHFNAAINGILGEKNSQYVDQLIKDLGLWEYRNLNWSELSGGYKMRFELTKVLAGKPKLLILDEPLANLDIKAQTSFLNDLKKFQQATDYPISIIVSSQHLYKIEEVSDQLIFLQKGKCIYQGPVQQMDLNEGQHVYEIMVMTEHEKLELLLQNNGIVKIKRSGNTYIVHSPTEYHPKVFLNLLLDGDIELHSYRNISKSTRQFFE